MSESGEDMDRDVQHADLLFAPWNQQRHFHVGSACPGVRLRGNGLFESKCGQLASFIIRLSPALLTIPITSFIRNGITGDVTNIHLQVMYNYGYRCIYTLNEPGYHEIIIKVGLVELPPIRIESKENENFVEDLIQSNEILLLSLKGSNDLVNELSKKCNEIQQKAKETLEKLRNATQRWMEALNATQVASDAAVEAANTAMEMVLNDQEEENLFSDSETEDDDVFFGSHDEDDDDDDDDDENNNQMDPIYRFPNANHHVSPIVINVRQDIALEQVPEDEEADPVDEQDEDEIFPLSAVKRRLDFSDEELSEDERASKRRRSISSEGTLSAVQESSDDELDNHVNVHRISPSPSPQSTSSRAPSRGSSASRSTFSSRSSRSRNYRSPSPSPSPSPPPSPPAPQPSRRRCGHMELRDGSPLNYRRFYRLRGGS